MSYLLFYICGLFMIHIAQKIGFDSINDELWICLAILSGAEAIAWRVKK